MEVRYAEAGDIGTIVDVVRRAQDALTETGSQQRLTLPSPDAVAAHIAARGAYVLAEGGTILGSVFVEAATVRRMPVLARWGLDGFTYPLRYLHTLVIEPAMQGRGLGHVLLNGVKAAVAAHGPATIVLDCWAGNATLRAFYARAGFHLHGIFAEADYEIAVFVSPRGCASLCAPTASKATILTFVQLSASVCLPMRTIHHIAEPMGEYLTVGEAAALLKVHKSTIWRWIESGSLPAYRVGRRGVPLKKEDLERSITPVGQEKGEGEGQTVQEHERTIRPLTTKEQQQGGHVCSGHVCTLITRSLGPLWAATPGQRPQTTRRAHPPHRAAPPR